MAVYRDRGIVLRTYKLGEADRIVVLLTRGHGKVRAVAKGVRKTRSKFGARLEPTSSVHLQLYEGRELDIVTQVETAERFSRLRDDLDRLSRAVALLEAVDHLALEREADHRLHDMLAGALRALDQRDSPLIVAAFYWKLLAHTGLEPLLDQCVGCGATDDLVAFDVTDGGVRCRACRRGTPVSAEGLALLRRILGGQLGAALNEETSAATGEVEGLAVRSLEQHIERRIRSMTLIS